MIILPGEISSKRGNVRLMRWSNSLDFAKLSKLKVPSWRASIVLWGTSTIRSSS